MMQFTAEDADGTVDVEVSLDTTELAGHDIVFFEKLADEQENVVATHEDIDDEGQTVSIPAEDVPGKGYPKTGALADVDPVAASLLVIAACGVCGACYAYIRGARKRIAAIEELESEVLEGADEE